MITVNGNTVRKVTCNNNMLGMVVCNADIVYIASLSVKSLPSKQSYFVGDSLDVAELSIYAHYNNKKIKIINEGFTCSPAVLNTAGKQTITITYCGRTTSFTVTVTPIVLQSIAIKTMPTKTSYWTGETLNTTGLTLTASYNNGATNTLSASEVSCTPTSLNTAGTQTITVSYGGKSTTFNITVTAIVVTSVSIRSNPSVTSGYWTGDTLNTSGLTLTASYNNDTSKTISSGFTCSPTTLNSSGTQTITVSYGGKSTTFNVSVLAAVNCTFPKSGYVLTSDTGGSIKAYASVNANNSNQAIYKAFDCSDKTAYVSRQTGGYQDTVGLGVVFPFNIRVISVTINSLTSNYDYDLGNIMGVEAGTVYINANPASGTFTGTAYASFSGRNGNVYQTGTYGSQSSISTNNVCVLGTQWNTTVPKKNHAIAEFIINFKALASDLSAAGLSGLAN